MLNPIRQRGLTLIEIVVALTILGFALVAAMPSIVDWSQGLAVRNAAESIKGGIEKARQEALKRNSDMTFWLVSDSAAQLSDSCVLSISGPSWVVSKLDPAGKCGVAPSASVDPRTVESWSASEGARNAQLSVKNEDEETLDRLSFTALGQLAGGKAVSIGIGHSAGDSVRRLRLEVELSGSVRMCDPAVTTAGDTRRCRFAWGD